MFLTEESRTHMPGDSSMRGATAGSGRRRERGDVGDTPDARCAMVAGEQHGCITVEQARSCRLSDEAIRRRTQSGRWRRVLPRTYVLRGAPETWEQRLMAALLWAGDGAVASGPSAAALWELPDFEPGPVQISHEGAKQSGREVTVRRVVLGALDVSSVRGIPVTSPARTLADLAGTLSPRRFDAALHHCLHNRIATLEDLREVSDRRAGAGHPGAGRLRDAVDAYAGRPAASPLEARLAARLRRTRLPLPVRQHEVRTGARRRYLDFAWPDRKVAVEVDGYRWHSSRAAWERDRERLAELRRLGWTIVHVTHDDVERGFEDLAAELRTCFVEATPSVCVRGSSLRVSAGGLLSGLGPAARGPSLLRPVARPRGSPGPGR